MMQKFLDPVLLLRSYLVLTTVAAVTANSAPFLRKRVLHYGPRRVSSIKAQPGSRTLLDKIATFDVPHAWFAHFYLISVTSSLFWAFQYAVNGTIIHQVKLAVENSVSSGPNVMTKNQVLLTWTLMFLQGFRRLSEQGTFGKKSHSKMPASTWILGMIFYVIMGIAVWIEGVTALLDQEPLSASLQLGKPSLKTFLAIPVFIAASGVQHDCHEYLASLQDYVLPENVLFKYMLCPHYTCECLIYLALAVISAPPGLALNRTIFLAFVFTSTNLVLTAQSTKEWYVGKFGATKISNRWMMVPYVF